MQIKIRELLKIQEEVNAVIRKKLTEDVSVEEFIVAFNVEFFEFINEVGVWKWWKHSHKINKERVLDELADLYAFYLSIVPMSTYKTSVLEKEINRVIEALSDLDKETDPEVRLKHTKDLIIMVGTDNEGNNPNPTTIRFAIANVIAKLVIPELTFEQIVKAYEKKSQVNIDRQKENY